MKKINKLFLVLVFSLLLCACGKSEAVKNVEAMIKALGEISLESIDAIRAAEDAYSSLTEEEQEKVKNYKKLTEARDTYYELVLVGQWNTLFINPYDLDRIYEREWLTLNADMSLRLDGKDSKVKWFVENGVLLFDTFNAQYVIHEDGDRIFLSDDDDKHDLIAVKDIEDYFSEIFKVVDLSEVDINDYCDLYIYEKNILNDFDEPTGEIDTQIMIKSKLFEEGWYCYSYSEAVIEVVFPEYTETWISSEGNVWTNAKEASITTMNGIPFNAGVKTIGRTHAAPRDDIYTDLTEDQITLGRAKGVLYFIHEDYVKEVKRDNGSRNLVLVDWPHFSQPELYTGLWDENIDY